MGYGGGDYGAGDYGGDTGSGTVSVPRIFPDQKEHKVHCRRCGFINDTLKNFSAKPGDRTGWGTKMTAFEVSSLTYDDASLNYDQGFSLEYEDVGIGSYDQSTYSGLNLNYDGSTSGTGNNITNGPTYDGVTRTIYDPVVFGGCAQCGTLLYK
jgi:hypothetical protein